MNFINLTLYIACALSKQVVTIIIINIQMHIDNTNKSSIISKRWVVDGKIKYYPTNFVVA